MDLISPLDAVIEGVRNATAARSHLRPLPISTPENDQNVLVQCRYFFPKLQTGFFFKIACVGRAMDQTAEGCLKRSHVERPGHIS